MLNLTHTIVEATTEVFSTMLMIEAVPGEPITPDSTGIKIKSNVSGMIGLTGLYRGVLAIHAPKSAALAMTGYLLGIEVPEINEDVQDALGEMANMLAGSLKLALSKMGKDIKLSIPSVITGDDYTLACFEGTQGVVVPFTIAEGTFVVEVQLMEES